MCKRPSNAYVKQRLFLECGSVDMYSMEHYAKNKLTLHHEPPFRETKHTVIEESYLLAEETHKEIEHIQETNYEKYKEIMETVKKNKELLMARRLYR